MKPTTETHSVSAPQHSSRLRTASERSHAISPIPVLRAAWGSWHVSLEREPLHADDLTAQYNRIAPTWKQRLHRLGVPKAYDQLMHHLLTDGALHTLPSGAWVLDAGIGTGALSLALDAQYRAQQHKDRLMFSGVDRSPAMLDAALTELDAANVDIVLRRADINHLPFEDNTFDLVMAGHVVEHLSCPETALQELIRVLRPGAPLLLLTTRQSLLGAVVHLRWRVHRFGKQDLFALLQAAGLEDIRCAPLPGALWNRSLSLVCTARKAKVTKRKESLLTSFDQQDVQPEASLSTPHFSDPIRAYTPQRGSLRLPTGAAL